MSDHTNHDTKSLRLAEMAWNLAKESAPPDLKIVTIPEWNMLGVHHQETYMQYLALKGAMRGIIEATAFMAYHHETCTEHGAPKFN